MAIMRLIAIKFFNRLTALIYIYFTGVKSRALTDAINFFSLTR